MQNFVTNLKISLLHLHCFCFCTAFLVLHRIYTKPALRHICTTFALRLHCTVITLPTSLLCTAPHCSYILFNVRFRTDSSSVRKKILETFHKIFRTESSSVRKKNCNIFAYNNSEPNPVRFGIFSHNFSKFPNYNSC